MSSGSGGPQDGPRGNRPESNQRRGGTNPPPGRGAGQKGGAGQVQRRGSVRPRRTPRPPQSRTSSQIEARRLAQQQIRRQRTMVGTILVGIVLLIAAIVVVVSALSHHGGSAAAPTTTPAATMGHLPTAAPVNASPIPTAPLIASAPWRPSRPPPRRRASRFSGRPGSHWSQQVG